MRRKTLESACAGPVRMVTMAVCKPPFCIESWTTPPPPSTSCARASLHPSSTAGSQNCQPNSLASPPSWLIPLWSRQQGESKCGSGCSRDSAELGHTSLSSFLTGWYGMIGCKRTVRSIVSVGVRHQQSPPSATTHRAIIHSVLPTLEADNKGRKWKKKKKPYRQIVLQGSDA